MRWKYVWRPESTDELFDLVSDPGELDDLARARPDVVERLSGLLQETLQRRPAGADASRSTDMSAEEAEQFLRDLDSLGYVGDD